MAKRYPCYFCRVVVTDEVHLPKPSKRMTQEGPDLFEYPLFRSQRKLARHLQQHHTSNKIAQETAEKLLVAVRQTIRVARGGGK